jgi:hypothetical protein
MNRSGPLKRRTRLRPRREPKAAPGWRAGLQRERVDHKAERAAEAYALTWGCEYSSEYLTLWRDPCPLCGLWRPPFVRHHLTRRRRGGLSEDIVLLCVTCHNKIHGTRAASSAPIREEDLLRPIADLLAAQARTSGYLPVERCDICGVWHSAKYMVNLIQEGQPTRRACTSLGWYARKAPAGTLPCVVDLLP